MNVLKSLDELNSLISHSDIQWETIRSEFTLLKNNLGQIKFTEEETNSALQEIIDAMILFIESIKVATSMSEINRYLRDLKVFLNKYSKKNVDSCKNKPNLNDEYLNTMLSMLFKKRAVVLLTAAKKLNAFLVKIHENAITNLIKVA